MMDINESNLRQAVEEEWHCRLGDNIKAAILAALDRLRAVVEFSELQLGHIERLNSVNNELHDENIALRTVISSCAKAIGAHVDVDASLGFISELPNEVQLFVAGRAQHAIKYQYQWFDTNPLNITYNQWSGWVDCDEGKYNEALKYIERGFQYEVRKLCTPTPQDDMPDLFKEAIEVLRENLRNKDAGVIRFGIYDNDKTRLALNVLLSASPQPNEPTQRITEQDAREVVKSWTGIKFNEADFEIWYRSAYKLFAKLNEYREPDYRAQIDVLPAEPIAILSYQLQDNPYTYDDIFCHDPLKPNSDIHKHREASPNWVCIPVFANTKKVSSDDAKL